MNTRTIATTLALLTVTGTAAFLAGRALATGAPVQTPLTYGGVVTDKDGKPYPTAQDVTIRFYDKADATVPKCVSAQVQTEAGTGRFSVVLPPECAQAVHEAPDLWTEAMVGASSTLLPRTHVGAVPYALEADAAKVAAGAGGGLKTTLDGLAADVAGLKAAPGAGKKSSVQTLIGVTPDGATNNNIAFVSGGGTLQLVGLSSHVCKAIPAYAEFFLDDVSVGLAPAATQGNGYFNVPGAVLTNVLPGNHKVRYVMGTAGKTIDCSCTGTFCKLQVSEF